MLLSEGCDKILVAADPWVVALLPLIALSEDCKPKVNEPLKVAALGV